MQPCFSSPDVQCSGARINRVWKHLLMNIHNLKWVMCEPVSVQDTASNCQHNTPEMTSYSSYFKFRQLTNKTIRTTGTILYPLTLLQAQKAPIMTHIQVRQQAVPQLSCTPACTAAVLQQQTSAACSLICSCLTCCCSRMV